jgi:hypothetical protein
VTGKPGGDGDCPFVKDRSVNITALSREMILKALTDISNSLGYQV